MFHPPMTPQIDTFSPEEFREYANQQDDYTTKPLQGTKSTVGRLLTFLDQVDHDVRIQVRTDSRRAGTVLGLTAVVKTAGEVKTIYDTFSARVIEEMADHSEDDAVQIDLMFD